MALTYVKVQPDPIYSRERANTLAFQIFEAPALRQKLRKQPKLDVDQIWIEIVSWISKAPAHPDLKSSNLIVTHKKLLDGVPGEALFVSAALAFDSLKESLPFFELSQKTAKQRLGHPLPTAEGEMALRLGRAFVMAKQSFGDAEIAREYLKTPNFALGGKAPRDLLKTAEGEQIVLNEIQTQAEGGPL